MMIHSFAFLRGLLDTYESLDTNSKVDEINNIKQLLVSARETLFSNQRSLKQDILIVGLTLE